MQLTFLGTGAGTPSLQRNVSAMGLTFSDRGAGWLFDCGEGTQHQIMRSALTPARLEKIFITHLHGDHVFGLPGLLTSRSMSGVATPLTLYGPEGLKTLVETTLALSHSYATFPLEIIEIKPGLIFDDGKRRVTAWPMAHVIECYGFRIDEYDKPGVLLTEKLQEHQVPRGPWFQQLKQGEDIVLADGRTIIASDYLGPPLKGRSLALFGDTGPTPVAAEMAASVDVMVHETTLEAAMAEKANSRGHSTTLQAAAVAQQAGAKKLIATHFSARYRIHECDRLLAECRSIFANTVLATDFATFEI